MSTTTVCPNCRGEGKIIHQPCRSCGGTGGVRKHKKVSVKIPAGIDNGQAISVRGQGDMGRNGGPAGDLIVGINVKPHARLRRDGPHIYLDQTVTFLQAALGAEVEIPSLDGNLKFTVPEGTQPGTTLRLRGKGVPVLNGRGRGDQYVTVRVEVPRNLTEQQKEALRAFGQAMGEVPGTTKEAAGEEDKGIFHRKKKK
jgi:molecular chaperone DnaJ